MLFVLTHQAKAQYVSLNELMTLREKDSDFVNDYLLARGWRFTEATDETQDEYAVVSWGYRVNQYNAAASFINLRSGAGYPPNITYQTINKYYYSLYKKQIYEYNMQKISTEVEDGEVVTIYAGENYIVKISIGTDRLSGIPTYRFNARRKR